MSTESVEPRQFSITLGQATLIVVAWGAAVWLVLQLQFVTFGTLHGICGPWGCGPPLSVLVACHGFLLVALGPPTCFGCSVLNPRRLLIAGFTALIAGLLAISGVAAWEATHWLPATTEFQSAYFPQRWLFSVAVRVDVPMIELTVFGLLAVICGWRRTWEARANDSHGRNASGSEETPTLATVTSTTKPAGVES